MAGQDSTTWIRRFHPAGDGSTRLVCLPHAGGSASFFFPVSASLSPRLEVLAVQYPGRQDRRHDPVIDDVHLLADRVTAALQPYADRPLALFGHSLGATLAYEVALRLEAARDEPVAHLFASGRRAPSRYRDEDVHKRGDAALMAELRMLNGTETALLDDPETRAMVMPSIRSDYKAIETYRHRPGGRLKAPVTAITGDDDPKTSLDEARDWAAHTTGPFRLEVLPGGHFFLIPRAAQVLRLISETLTPSRTG
ncbi:thioesterase II family protein [Dactylosporangium sucinum]|uniref:Oleoyl-ACP hydrolase n=1 Tax=Dactylosporangium sucinum TaxID=1424081 RepID=A0A917UAE5_9ACTN|nr:alpha/beta fold hydrolase [Dactylosporangium sucinum]GGM70998.1 oleoyl-ACP hydrolase [Dactylosporangium sucinum]